MLHSPKKRNAPAATRASHETTSSEEIMANPTATALPVKLSHQQLKALAMELNAALPPPEPADPGERELLQLYRLLDEGRKDATRRFLSAMA